MQGTLQTAQLLPFPFRQTLGRDLRPLGNHSCNLILIHDPLFLPAVSGIPTFQLLFLHFQLLLLPAQFPGLCKVFRDDGLLLGFSGIFDLLLYFFQAVRSGKPVQAHLGGRLVHQVDGLVRQEPIIDIPAGKAHSCLHRTIRDLHVMVRLITAPQPLQDQDGLGLGGLFHIHRLEPALQGCIFFNIFPVFLHRRRTDELQFSPGQRRF